MTITCNLSWSQHINNLCKKTKRILGVIYRQYYQFSTNETLRQLYISLVRPHLEYACQVWDPHLERDIKAIEAVQKFALCMVTKQWNLCYNDLLHMCTLPSLALRRSYLRLSTLFKINRGDMYFSDGVFTERHTVGRQERKRNYLQDHSLG